MPPADSRLVEQSLARPDIHLQWEATYRTAENERFFELAFDTIARILGAPRNGVILDAGCGPCSHAKRLARRGFRVEAVDFSASILALAKANVEAAGLAGRVSINRGDLLALPFGDATFEYVLCWGVLMHIPAVERAVAELMRVTRPGGLIVVAENNKGSLQSAALRILKRLRWSERAEVRRMPAGVEYWTESAAGPILVRQANIDWLIDQFERGRFDVRHRIAGQFTELYTKISSPLLRRLIHEFNNFWFRYVRAPRLAFGNIVVAQKRPL
jgi:ubiquinone/menaquinone biosynthesis C-methylase UbiE